MAKKGVPLRNATGKGRRDNKGRGGCSETREKGKGSNRR
jgi:hypothetical protein